MYLFRRKGVEAGLEIERITKVRVGSACIPSWLVFSWFFCSIRFRGCFSDILRFFEAV